MSDYAELRRPLRDLVHGSDRSKPLKPRELCFVPIYAGALQIFVEGVPVHAQLARNARLRRVRSDGYPVHSPDKAQPELRKTHERTGADRLTAFIQEAQKLEASPRREHVALAVRWLQTGDG